jgi:CHAD domain-containing protein
MEIEAKYRIVAALGPAALEQVDLAPYRLVYGGEHALHDEVVDTAARALTGGGFALRRRRDGARLLITLKGPGEVDGAVHRREEIEVEADADALARGEWPEPVWTRVGDLVGEGTLETLVSVDNQRRVWRIEREGAELGELALDEGTIRAGGREQPFRELEVELKGDGTARDLEQITARLVAELPLTPEPQSKFGRGLALLQASTQPVPEAPVSDEVGTSSGSATAGAAGASERAVANAPQASRQPAPHPAPETLASEAAGSPGADATGPTAEAAVSTPAYGRRAEAARAQTSNMSAATPSDELPTAPTDPARAEAPGRRPLLALGQEVILRNLEKLHAAEPVARAGEDPEGVHDLRVATRRLRAALQVLEDTVADAAETRRFRRGLRGLANGLGEARDADVFLIHLDGYAAQVSPEEAAGLRPLRDDIEKRRSRGRKAVLAELDSKRTRRLLRRLRAWAEREPAPDKPRRRTEDLREPPRPVWVRHFAPSALWRRYEEVIAFETAMPASVPILHLLRISGKRFRYTLEFFQDALGPGARDLLKQLITVQDRLGELHDAEVAKLAIDELSRRKNGTAALQAYRDRRRDDQARLAADFGTDWAVLAGPSFRNRLSRLLAEM